MTLHSNPRHGMLARTWAAEIQARYLLVIG